MEVGNESNPRADESGGEEAYTERTSYMHSPDHTISNLDWRQFVADGWVASKVAEGCTSRRPPAYLFLYHDLFLEGWGWDFLIPYDDDSVSWSEFKGYLQTYFDKNVSEISNLCNCQNNGQGVTDANFLQAAAKQCIETERMFLSDCYKYISFDDIRLSGKIKKHAKHIIKSGDASSIAAAGLACVIKEAELMCKSVELELEDGEIFSFGNEIRRFALNLMLYEGTEVTKSQNDVASAAMVGIAKEAKYLCDLLSQEDQDPDMHVKYLNHVDFRTRAAKVLTMLEKEFYCPSDVNADMNVSPASNTSEKSIGVSTVSGLNCDESGSEEMDTIEHCQETKLYENRKLKDGNETELSLTVIKDKDLERKCF